MSANVRSTDTASVKLRSASIDQFRFLAFVGVLFIHFDASWGGGDDWIANFVRFGSFVGRFAVPFFFITAGYFLKLERGREGATIWGYVKRLFVPFLVWDGFYLLTDTIANPTYYLNEMTKGAFWRDVIINGGPGYHLWFLSSLFLCLAMVIIGRRFLSPRSVVAVSALFFSVGLVCGPYAALLFGADNQVHFFTRNGPFFGLLFVALGACGKQALDKISLRAGTALAVGGFALLTFECWWTALEYEHFPR